MMGNPVGKEVVGRIYHVVEEDLYIDFGHKFGCVCRLPREGRRNYIRGTEVRKGCQEESYPLIRDISSGSAQGE